MCLKTSNLKSLCCSSKIFFAHVLFVFVFFLSHLQAYSDGTHDFPGPLLPEQKKKGRNKRAPKAGEKPVSRYKKRKKEGDERQLMHTGPDSVMTQIKQVSWFIYIYIYI